MEYRYFIRVRGSEAGWIYLHNIGEYEDDDHIQLWNELVPGDQLPMAVKADYLEITKNQYEKIVNMEYSTAALFADNHRKAESE